MGFLNLFGALSPIHIWWVTLFSGGKQVGTDQYGNKYYRAPPRHGYSRERRWVLYKGEPEASLIPPEWHGWMHHQTDTVPEKAGESYRQPWQKPYHPNRTGTDKAYRPPGHLLSGGERDRATGDYEPWTPSDTTAKEE